MTWRVALACTLAAFYARLAMPAAACTAPPPTPSETNYHFVVHRDGVEVVRIDTGIDVGVHRAPRCISAAEVAYPGNPSPRIDAGLIIVAGAAIDVDRQRAFSGLGGEARVVHGNLVTVSDDQIGVVNLASAGARWVPLAFDWSVDFRPEISPSGAVMVEARSPPRFHAYDAIADVWVARGLPADEVAVADAHLLDARPGLLVFTDPSTAIHAYDTATRELFGPWSSLGVYHGLVGNEAWFLADSPDGEAWLYLDLRSGDQRPAPAAPPHQPAWNITVAQGRPGPLLEPGWPVIDVWSGQVLDREDERVPVALPLAVLAIAAALMAARRALR